ncbi:MAG TPA: ATP-binding protein [Ktedonobacteraceae bacterium]
MRKDIRQVPQTSESRTDQRAGQERVAYQARGKDAIRHRSDEGVSHAEISPGEADTETPHGENTPRQSASIELIGRAAQERDLSYWADYLEHAPSAVVAVDEQLRVYDLNPSASARLGFSSEEARGRSCREVLMCRNMNGTLLCGTSNCPWTRVVQDNETVSATDFLLGACSDAGVEYSVNVGPARVNASSGAVFVAQDLSRMKVANQVRANFVSMVSHELRTPLNSVNGFIDLLAQGHMGALNEEQRLYLGYTQVGVQQLMTIVEDILFMTRSDSGQFEIKPQKTNSRVLAKQVVTSLKMQARKAAVILDKDIPDVAPLIYADQQRMQQVLCNLVTNAIKFTPPHGTVTIRVRPHPEQADKVLFSVIDTGDGIPPKDQPHIFERFYQSNHAMQSRMGGYGLGLSIARLIVEQHGGQISFESEPQQGTTFYFTAPLWMGQGELPE